MGSRDGDNVALIVGPQGDFTAAELDAIMTAGAQPAVCFVFVPGCTSAERSCQYTNRIERPK